jgi:hypothetical protein
MDDYSDPTPVATVEQFRRALRTLVGKRTITPTQTTMLQEHCRAPAHTMTSQELAAAAKYPNYETANAQYGKLAHNIADLLGYKPPECKDGDPRWWRMIAIGLDGSPRDATGGAYRWVMRPELVQALQEMGWVRR